MLVGGLLLLLDWLFGTLLGGSGGGLSMAGIVLFVVQLIVLVVQLVLVGRARRYRLEAERHAMRAEESLRSTEREARR